MIERIRNLFGKEPQQKSKLLGTQDSLVEPIPAKRPFDQKEVQREQKRLAKDLTATYEQLGQAIVMKSPKNATRFSTLRQKIDDCFAISSIYADQFKEMELTGGGKTVLEAAILHVTSLGLSLVVQNTLRQQLEIAEREEFADRFRPYTEVYKYAATSELGIKIDGISLRDFITFKGKQDSPVPYLNFLLYGRLIAHEGLHREVLAQNQGKPYGEYPNITISTIDVLPNKIISLSYLNPEAFDHLGGPPLIQEIGQQAKKLIQTTVEVVTSSRKLLLNPASPEFPTLRELILSYLESGDKTKRVVALNILSAGRIPYLFDVYREAQRLIRKGNNSEFYQTLVTAVREYVEEASNITTVLTKEDIPPILNLVKVGDLNPVKPSTLEGLGKQVGAIFSKTSRKIYEINSNSVNLNGFATPESIKISFDANRPKKFTINLAFNNELGEAVDLGYTLDTQKNTMDWVLLEDPMSAEDQEVAYFRDNLLMLTGSILQDVARQVNEEFNLRHEKPQIEVSSPSQQVKRERFADPVYKLRKEVRIEQISKGEVLDADIVSVSIEDVDIKVRNQVLLPVEQELQEKLKYVSSMDGEIIKQALAEYNEKGTGSKFTRKKKLGPDGQPRYTLAVGCTVPKGVRVLLREVSSENGIRNFEVLDIRYRKDIYRLNKL